MPGLRGSRVPRSVGVPLESRIARLEKRVKDNTGELKQIDVEVSSTALVAQAYAVVPLVSGITPGPLDGQREGSEIKIFGYKLCPWVNNSIVDVYLILSLDGNAPTGSIFQNVPGGLIKHDFCNNFKILKYMRNYGSTEQHMAVSERMKKRLMVRYDGNLAVTQNGLYVVYANRAPSLTHNYSLGATIYYKDS